MLNTLSKKAVLGILAGASLLSAASLAQATEFTIDQFTVTKNGNVIFDDNFDDALSVPTFSNGNAAAYATNPTPLPGAEANGRLVMDPFAGAIINSKVTGQPIYMNRARLLTNSSNNNSNINKGLKDDDTFSVTGLFDLTLPTQAGERFGVRLTDQKSNNPNAGDVVEMAVRNVAGSIFVQFREQDRPNAVTNILEEIELNYASFGMTESTFAMYDQIALSLSRSGTGAADGDIYGSFRLVDSSNSIGDYRFAFQNSSSTIFEGERFTRAEFLAIAQVAVPEASTIFLFALGMLGLFSTARRKL